MSFDRIPEILYRLTGKDLVTGSSPRKVLASSSNTPGLGQLQAWNFNSPPFVYRDDELFLPEAWVLTWSDTTATEYLVNAHLTIDSAYGTTQLAGFQGVVETTSNTFSKNVVLPCTRLPIWRDELTTANSLRTAAVFSGAVGTKTLSSSLCGWIIPKGNLQR